ncbi:2Fe-2S iron-sulfur cluster-binding protein [Spirosoma soli]|uniref:2Fe-2S iron-sulfur cluster-binding protein n=1 Tax=Spirosoma soli TaxID=1770529 RepID=A0ABW5M9L7_9BACT
MTDDYLKLRVTHIKQETPDTKSYFLESLDKQPVTYRAGQFLTLIIQHNDGAGTVSQLNVHEVRRSYSISSAPGEPLRLTIKRVQNGEISRYLLDTLHIGDVLKCLPPAGRFTLDETSANLVLLGAGSGITPLLSILKQALQTGRQVTLLYSAPSERNTIFREELEELHQRFKERFRLLYLLSNPSEDWNGLRGRLNNVMLERLLPTLVGDSDRESLQFYVCGPGDYMRMVQFTLVFSGIRPEQIRRENFVITPVTLTPPPALAVDRTVLLKFRNREVEVQVPAYKSILQAALDEGVHLPYSCRGGRCSTCIARCRSGSVHMTINDVLTERDLVEGWVLTCTGYPETDGVVIEV